MTPSQTPPEGSEKPISAPHSPSGVVEKSTTSAPQSPSLGWEKPKSPPQSPSRSVETSVLMSSSQSPPVLVENPWPDPPPSPESPPPGWQQTRCEPHLQVRVGKQSPPPGLEQLSRESHSQVGVVTESPPPGWEQPICEPHLQLGVGKQSPPPEQLSRESNSQVGVREVKQALPPGWEQPICEPHLQLGVGKQSPPPEQLSRESHSQVGVVTESPPPGWEQPICEQHLQLGVGKQSPPPEQLSRESNSQVGVRVKQSLPPGWEQPSCEPHLQVGVVTQSPPPGWERPITEQHLQVREVTQLPPPGWEKQTSAPYSTTGSVKKSTPFIAQSPLRELENQNLSSPSRSCLLGKEKRSPSTPLQSPPPGWKRKCPSSPLTTEEEKDQSSSFMLPLPLCEENNLSSPPHSPPPGWERIPSGYAPHMAPLVAENSSILQQSLHSRSGLPETSAPCQLPELVVPLPGWESTGLELPLLKTSESTSQPESAGLDEKSSSQMNLHLLLPETIPEKNSNSLLQLGSESKSVSEVQSVPPPGWENPSTPPESPPPGWEKPNFPQRSPLPRMEKVSSSQQKLNDQLESDKEQLKGTIFLQQSQSGTESALTELQMPPLPASPPDMGQMVCGSCKELLSYPLTAKLVKCSCCQMVNFVLEEHEVGNVKCGKCAVLLIYPYGAPSVRCSCCRFVTKVGAHNIRPPLSVQQGRPLPASLQC